MADKDKEAKQEAKKEAPEKKKTEFVKLEKPDRTEHDAKIQKINDEIKIHKDALVEVKDGFDKLQESQKKGNEKIGKDIKKLNELRATTRKHHARRKELMDRLRKAKETRDRYKNEMERMMKTLKDIPMPPPQEGPDGKKKGPRFTVERVDNKIRSLEYYLATNALSLKEEKNVIAEMKQLSGSKKIIGEFDEVKKKRDDADSALSDVKSQLDELKVHLTKATKEEEEQGAKVDAQRNNDKEKNFVQGLKDKRAKARKELDRLYSELRQSRDEFQQKEAEFRAALNERRREQRQRQKEEEAKWREEERLRKEEEAEEKEANLHADKFATIDQLVAYLEKFVENEKPQEEEAKVEAAGNMEGMVEIGKSVKGFDDDIFGTKKSKSKKGKKNKKKKVFSHDLNCLNEFAMLKIEAPLNVDAIAPTLKALEEKRSELQKDKDDKRAKRLAKKAAQANEKEGAKEEETEKDKENNDVAANADEGAAVEASS